MSDPHQNPNLAQLLAAAAKLEPLLEQIVFVGCITGLLITDPAAAPVRPTLDVDAIIEIASYSEFSAFGNRLRDPGFDNSHAENAPICRWTSGDLLLDLMPTDPSILGFTNRWYTPAFDHAKKLKTGKHEIRVITAPYFLATKVEAFHGRGNNDFSSHDLEDVVTVIDGRPELADEVHLSPTDLQKYLSSEFQSLLSTRDFLDALPGHLLFDMASQQRAGLVLRRMKQLILEG